MTDKELGAGGIGVHGTGHGDHASSQFFICHQDSTFLDGQYAGFGEVTEGIEVVDKICEDAKPVDNNGTILDGQPVIEKMTVRFE